MDQQISKMRLDLGPVVDADVGVTIRDPEKGKRIMPPLVRWAVVAAFDRALVAADLDTAPEAQVGDAAEGSRARAVHLHDELGSFRRLRWCAHIFAETLITARIHLEETERVGEERRPTEGIDVNRRQN